MPKFEDGSYGSLTGIALIGKVLAGRCGMKYTRASVGNGVIPDDQTPKTMLGPAGYIMDAKIAAVSSPIDGECQVTVEIKSDDVETGFYATSIVLYAEDPDVGEVPYTYLLLENEPEWIRPASSIVGKLATFDLIAAVGAVDAVTAVIDSESIASLLAAQPSIPLVSIDHRLDCYPQVMVATCPHSAGISGAGNGPAGGTDMESFPAKPIYHGRNSLTIKTVKSLVELGSRPILHRLSATEYAVTFADNPTTSVYIQLICSTSTGTPSLPTDAVAIKNIVFSTTPPSDTSVLWGEPN